MSISLDVGFPTAIPNYDDLQTEIAKWLNREGDTDMEARIPSFILLAESYFNRELRTPEMESSKSFSVSDEDTPLPQDYLAMRAVYQETTPDNPLTGMSPDQLRLEYLGQSGPMPRAYAIVGGGIRVAPVPQSTLVFTMDYFRRIDNLSVESPSNWLLEKHPDLYLFASLFYADQFNENPQRAVGWGQLASNIIERIKTTSTAARWGAGTRPNTVHQYTRGRC